MITKKQFRIWVDALRSGRYEQWFGSKKGPRRNTYCAVGILEKINGTKEYCGLPFYMFNFTVKLNDSSRMPFSEIADWIEGIATAEGWM